MTISKRAAVSAALAISAAFGGLMAAAPAAHAGWERDVRGTTPAGRHWTFRGHGSCAHGECQSQQRFVGPRGGVWTRRGETRCYGGSCEGRAVFTGPRGRSWSRERSFRRY